MSQMPDLGAVSAQTSMDAAALVTDQHASVYRGPAGLCNRMKNVTRLQSNYGSQCTQNVHLHRHRDKWSNFSQRM